MAIPPTRTVSIQDRQGRFDRLREAANESARSFRTAYTFYLIVALYILVIVSATHQELLFRAGNVQMPIVNVGVPVVWFFTGVPWLLVLLHFNLLVQAIFLANKVSQYAAVLGGQGWAGNERSEALGLLYPAPLAHKVADADQQGSMRRILNVIVFVTLAVLPPAILIFAQVRFLPYQDEWRTWLHRAAVVIDIGLLWWLWPHIAAPHIMTWRTWFGTQKLKALATVGVTVFAIGFSALFADFPGGTMGNLTPSLDSRRNDLLGRTYDLSNRVLVDTEPAPEILAAHYRATCESGNGCDESAIAVGSSFWCNHAKPLQLRRRNFRNAMLSGSTLCQATLWGAELHGANLFGAKLRGANLLHAELHGADLLGAELHGATLRHAELHGARLETAKLHGADLLGAELHGATLWGAELHGADLKSAKLRGADLLGAKLHGADLRHAELHGAILGNAEFHGAILGNAQLHGASSHLEDWRKPFEAVINSRIGKGSDLSGAIFAGGLSRKYVASIETGLPDEEAKELRGKLAEHIGKPVSHELPENSGAITGAYTKEDAAQWIAEYQTAVSGGG